MTISPTTAIAVMKIETANPRGKFVMHAALALGDRDLPGGGYETVMINCNPEARL